ncbi:MAG: hypothetical protein GC168_10405 [Candidatus Hydrogenedens sp.]|nr:hypothetical protein [Candidatus Hydrogenedens sp.]
MSRNRMNEFAACAQAARHDTPPAIDVSRQVIYRISALQEEGFDRPLAWLTATSLAAAAASMLLTTSLYGAWSDPLSALFHITPVLGQ